MEKKNFKKKNNKMSQRAKAAKIYVKINEDKWGGACEYKMPFDLYNQLMKEAKNFRKEAHEYLCDYVNEQEGILQSCVRVIPY